jgi:hypothetical protein
VAEPIGSSWEELNAALVNCFRLSTDAANWCVHALFRRDTPNDPKTPQTVKPRGKNSPAGFYSYGEYLSAHPGCTSKSGTWSGAAQSLNICLRYAERKYRDERFDVMVRHKSGLLSVRYPYPFPVDADAWTPSYAGGGFPTVSLTLPGHGKFTLRLKRRADFGRQLAMFKALHDGTAKKGEAALYRNGKGDLLLKLVGHFPRRDRGPAVNAAFINTDPAALLVVEVNGRTANVTNADHIRREFAKTRTMIARHKRLLQRAGEDKKRELRMDRQHRANLNDYIADRCDKQNNRVKTFVQQVAAQVARMLQRQGVAIVAYDDSKQDFMPDGFRWSDLKTRISQLVNEMGCEWIDGTTEGVVAKAGAFPPLTSEDRQTWLLQAKALLRTTKQALAAKSRPRGKSHPAVSTTAAT